MVARAYEESPDGTGYLSPIICKADKKTPIQAKIVIPFPDQISKSEIVPNVAVFRVPKPDPEGWSQAAGSSFVALWQAHSDKTVLSSGQLMPNKTIFYGRVLPEEPDYFYFLVHDIAIPTVGKFECEVKVHIAVKNSDASRLPDTLWKEGKRSKNPATAGNPHCFAGQLVTNGKTPFKVKAEAGLKMIASSAHKLCYVSPLLTRLITGPSLG